MIEREVRGSTLILRLAHGKASALDLELLQELHKQTRAFREQEHRALVLTGTGSIFSAGVDLKRILDSGPGYVDAFLAELSLMLVDLFTLPKPVIAAINGHAIAGGCVLAAACDRRLMAEGQGKFGVTELYVGVPFPAVALEILHAAFTPNVLRDLLYTGRLCSPPEALGLGIVDELVAADRLLDRALALAAKLGGILPDTFRLTKAQLNAPVVTSLAELDEGVRQVWNSDEARQVMQAFFDQAVGKKQS